MNKNHIKKSIFENNKMIYLIKANNTNTTFEQTLRQDFNSTLFVDFKQIAK